MSKGWQNHERHVPMPKPPAQATADDYDRMMLCPNGTTARRMPGISLHMFDEATPPPVTRRVGTALPLLGADARCLRRFITFEAAAGALRDCHAISNSSCGITEDHGLRCGQSCSVHRFELRRNEVIPKQLTRTEANSWICRSPSQPTPKIVERAIGYNPYKHMSKAQLASSARLVAAAKKHGLVAAAKKHGRKGRSQALPRGIYGRRLAMTASALQTGAQQLLGRLRNRSTGGALRRVRFVALIEGHSGSSWFCTMMGRHPCAFCNQERSCTVLHAAMVQESVSPESYFTALHGPSDQCERSINVGIEAAWAQDTARSLKQLGVGANHAPNCPVIAVGGKCQAIRDMLGMDHPAQTAHTHRTNATFSPENITRLTRLLSSPIAEPVRVLHMVRENAMEWLRSVGWLKQGLPPDRQQKRHPVDVQGLVAKVRSKLWHDEHTARVLQEAATRAGGRYLRLSYEQLCRNPHREHNET